MPDVRVLITGATGFAGRHLSAFCAAQGATVIGTGRQGAEKIDMPRELASYVECDLTDMRRTEELIRSTRPDRVFHLAAEASVMRSWEKPAEAIDANVTSTLNLLEAVRAHADAASILIACSGEEYGVPERLPVTEDHFLRPQNPYAVSKACADLTAGFYADSYGMHVVRTRAFNHAGPGQSNTYVVSNLARQIAEGEVAREGDGFIEVVTGNAQVRRDFTDVRDVVRAYWLALERAEAGVYNVCSGRSVAITEILEGLAGHTQLDVRTRTDPAQFRRREVEEIQGSHDKLTRATGWQPEIPLDQTLHDMLDWWRARIGAGVAS